MTAQSDPSRPDLSRRRLRTWIRLLRLTRGTENQLREYLRVTHDTTLPRFDVMAALYRNQSPMKMTALSKMLLVSNGNASTIVNRLEKDGLVERVSPEKDRRVVNVTLTAEGSAQFEVQAKGHEAMVNDLFDGLEDADLDQIRDLLRRADAAEEAAI
ncbi:MarR family winged helix-turn-helix transcriptional regulator [Sulfitobacter mediterraneus]|uniref:MarR family winged helix-turn-helix transcriptional regulator n=1 Tax=Sulfitobacter mediterraneus TaxID=83219 RepID=UPI002166E169|nr:MarR family transcriptional regulator [Sulfitobacter mediterraneus]